MRTAAAAITLLPMDISAIYTRLAQGTSVRVQERKYLNKVMETASIAANKLCLRTDRAVEECGSPIILSLTPKAGPITQATLSPLAKIAIDRKVIRELGSLMVVVGDVRR